MRMKSLLLPLTFALACLAWPAHAQDDPAKTARGTVYHDLNENQRRDDGEPGLPNILVSNQLEVVKTDAEGKWELPVREDCIFFVNKPSGWMTPVDEQLLPRFYYIHKPAGSPQGTKYEGVKPTGPLPETIDFPLYKQEEPEKFQALFFGDTQARDQKELDWMAHDVVEELMGTKARFGVTLGDILFDDLSLYDNHNALVALIGVPWYNVIGNHDLNFDSPDDKHSDETFERVYGPNYYAYSYGPVHFLVMDDVNWRGRGDGYIGKVGEEQLTFLRNLLPHIPEDEMLLLMMHIPIMGVEDRREVFELIEDRPYTMSISGHTHWQAHHFLTEEDGWKGKEPHHHIVSVTVCGSWWSGEPDNYGIPHTMMRDGAPNGYTLISFDKEKATVDFKAARRPASYQMSVFAPEAVTVTEAPEKQLYVNVFGGSERSKVKFRVGSDGVWQGMTKTLEQDPYFLALKEKEAATPEGALKNRPLPKVINSAHLWKATLPQGMAPGVHRIQVEAEDMYGRVFHGSRVIRVE